LNKIKLISDSTCDLSKELLLLHDIDIVPLYVNFRQESFFDGVNLSTIEMYHKIDKVGYLPKTAAASPGSFFELFDKYLTDGYQIIYTGIGSKFSATFQSAFTAKQMLHTDNIFLVDSGNLSSGSGLLLLKAAAFRNQGLDANEIYEKMLEIVPKIRTQFVIDTLDYLYKGGRLNALSTLMGTVLKVKPIIKVRNGEMVVGKKGRGSTRIGIDLMLNEILGLKEEIDQEFCIITHSMAESYVPYIRDQISEQMNIQNIYETEAGCVISSHCGKGAIGVLYIIK
jgi:DegV family protein with EDD domain